MKNFGKMFWRILMFGIIILLIEGIYFKDIKSSIGSSLGLILFIVTGLSTVFVSLYLSWKDGQIEILTSAY